MNNYFYVDVDEEITSVIGKLRKDNSDEAFLVVPKRAIISQSLVNLRLLEKEAKKLRKKLIFVSPDANTRKIAEKAGLSVKKYLAKPKDKESDPRASIAPQRKQPMQPWEEAAAKEELKKVISKTESQPTKIKAGVFSVPKITPKATVNPEPVSSRKSEVVDLKTLAARRRKPAPPRMSAVPKNQPEEINPEFEERIVDSRGNEIEKKIDFVEEPELKDLISNPDVLRETASLKPERFRASENKPVAAAKAKPQIAKVNPFRIKKLAKGTPSAHATQSVPVPIPAVMEAKMPIVPSPQPPQESQNIEAPSLPINEVQDKKMERFERETANLTMREKEKLRDLWMEQKKVVRGKTLHEGSLDLKPILEAENRKEEMIEEKGIFQTTHRRVTGTGKVIDLRSASTPLITLPKLTEDRAFRKKGKEIILPLFNVRLFIFFLLGIFAVLLVIIGIILPEATIAIKPKQSSDNLELKLWTSGEVSQIDFDQRIIPGKPVHFKVSEEKSFQATTEKTIKENSEGQVTIQNQSTESLSLKQNAMLTDSSGKKFYLTAPITIPAAKQGNSNNNSNANSNTNSSPSTTTVPGSADANVSAEGSGKDYNLKEGASLSVPGLKDSDFADLVTVEVKKEITGGESRTAKVVSQGDIDGAKQELIDQAKQDSLGQLENNLDTVAAKLIKPEDLAVEDVSFSSDKSAGEEAESFNASVSVTFFTISFSRDDLQNLAKRVIESDQEKKDGTAKINSHRMSDSKPLENKMEISANFDYQVKSQIDLADIQKFLVAKKTQEAQDYLKNRSDVGEFSLDVWPRFIGHMPILERRIKVELQ